MPSCYHGFINEVLDEYMKVNPQKVLDIGVGFGKWGSLFREYGDIFRGRLTKPEWVVEINGIEAFEDYKTPTYDFMYTHVEFDDVSKIYTKYKNYDLVFAGDIIEHLDKDVAMEILNFFAKNTKVFIVSIPLTDVWEQGEVFGNKFEEHKSVWSEEDFPDYEALIKTNPRGKPIGLFIHRN
jgi:hypothetical protein